MRSLWIACVLILCTCAFAEDTVNVDITPIYDFAEEYGFEDQLQSVYESAVNGEFNTYDAFIEWIKEQATEPLQTVARVCVELLPIVFLSALMSGMLPDGCGASSAVLFLLRLSLLLGFSNLATMALNTIESCIQASTTLIGYATPILSGLLTAAGMDGSAALLSPMTITVGNIAEKLFVRYGVPLCKIAFATAIAGNLSPQISLKGFTRFLMRVIRWGSGIVIAVFTGFLALQSNVSESLDGIAVRAAKYTVDSAAPVIGNGLSDAWENYLSGVFITKNAVGISGIAALFMAGAKPILLCLCAMACLNLIAALLDAFGERLGAEAAEQLAGVCQLALSLCTATMVISMVLLATIMSMEKGMGG